MTSVNPAELIALFEKAALDNTKFHHRDHIQVAWSYLVVYPFAEAAMRFTAALKHFATYHGTPQLYHETITWAYFVIIHERIQRQPARDWDSFALENEDLFAWKPSIIDRFYAPGTLYSDLARKIFVFPDFGRDD